MAANRPGKSCMTGPVFVDTNVVDPHSVDSRRTFLAVRAGRTHPTSRWIRSFIASISASGGSGARSAAAFASRRRNVRRRLPGPRPSSAPAFIEPLRRQKIERRAVRGNLEENGAVAAGVPAVGSSHDVDDPQQVLLVGRVHRLAAGPEVHAAPRHAEEPSDFVPGQSRRAAQFRDRVAREHGSSLGQSVVISDHGRCRPPFSLVDGAVDRVMFLV